MIFLPIRTDSPVRRTPVVNYAIILTNILVFLYMNYGGWNSAQTAVLEKAFALNGVNPKLHQFITYAFLHADWSHLLGNMLFLYIFGNNLNDKMGHIEYAIFYLAGAVFAAAGYTMTNTQSLVGASGAIAAVTGGFLVLFPRSHIEVFLWVFFYIDSFAIPSLYMIGFKMILWDNIIAPALPGPRTNVAYGAHLVGYAFGFVVPLILLALRALDRDQFDILALWSRILRRREYAQMTSHEGPAFRTARPLDVQVSDLGTTGPSIPDHSAPVAQLRNAIFESLGRFDLTTAVEKYRELLALDPAQILPRKEQLDIANQLMSLQDFPLAAQTYEQYLTHYADAAQVEQVQLLLGIIYSRYLVKPDRARDLLTQAKNHLRDPGQIALCDEELRRLGT